MNSSTFIIRKCIRPNCGFRFPLEDQFDVVYCPKCGSYTKVVETHFQNQELPEPDKTGVSAEIEVLLDNIRSSYNVGSIFRTADGAGVNKIYTCGITPPPDHPKVKKTALGAEITMPWEHRWDALSTVIEVKEKGYQIWALEGGNQAELIYDSIINILVSPILIIVGNEISGIDPGILNLCDKIIFIPMVGSKSSLNVSVAFGIAVYTLKYGQNNSIMKYK